jgi:hypothetical protein
MKKTFEFPVLLIHFKCHNIWNSEFEFQDHSQIEVLEKDVCAVKKIATETQRKQFRRKNAELERMNDLFVGREFRIKELRDRVEKLEGGLTYA